MAQAVFYSVVNLKDIKRETADDHVYSTVGQTSNPDSDQNLYSTLGQTSKNSPGAQRTEKSGQNSHPYRLAAVCLGLLCALLLTVIIALSVHYTSEDGHLSQNYTLMKTHLQQLRANYNTLAKDKDQLQKDLGTLAKDKDQLQKDKETIERENRALVAQERQFVQVKNKLETIIQEDRKKLHRWKMTSMAIRKETEEKVELQKVFDAVLQKSPFLDQYCPPSPKKRECSPCPQGWKQFNSKCYYFSTKGKTWMDSRIDCLKQGADLVIIESEEEQEFISRHATEDYYWIGLSDSVTEGTWIWVNRTPLQKGFWRQGEPDDKYLDGYTHTQNADCSVTVRENRWADMSCSSYIKYVCETDALLLPKPLNDD